MEENSTVSAPESASAPVVEPATVFAFGPESAEAVDAPAVAQEQPEEQQQTAGAEEPADGDGGQQLNGKNQKDIGHAFSQERKRLEAKYQAAYEKRVREDPTYRAGEMLIADIMDREGLPHDEAVKVAADRLMDAVSKREGISKGIVRRLYGQATTQPEQPEQTDQSDNGELFGGQTLEMVVQSLLSMDLPDGFDLDAATQDKDFALLLRDMPANAAVRVYRAEKLAAQAPKDVAEKLRARQKVPQSERPQQSVTPAVNYAAMSDDDFLSYKEKMQKERRR